MFFSTRRQAGKQKRSTSTNETMLTSSFGSHAAVHQPNAESNEQDKKQKNMKGNVKFAQTRVPDSIATC